MTGYKVPFQNAEAELIEKKSRFIGRMYGVTAPEEANEILAALRKREWDATHHVYAYILSNGVMRFSDDGEPQGTAGLPTLDVLKREEIYDVLCVTTRWFGGTLLGAGGLTRAYAKTCKLALDAAGIAVMQPFTQVRLTCAYAQLELLRQQLALFEAAEEHAEYAADVTLSLCLPSERFEAFAAHLIDVTNGRVAPERGEEKLFAKKLS